MTRSQLIAKIANRFPSLVQRDAYVAVELIVGAMADALASGGRVEIRGVGSFSLSYRPPRLGRNPATGERVTVPGKYVPHFKPGKDLAERVRAAPGVEPERLAA